MKHGLPNNCILPILHTKIFKYLIIDFMTSKVKPLLLFVPMTSQAVVKGILVLVVTAGNETNKVLCGEY
jgi:hypothetical protein